MKRFLSEVYQVVSGDQRSFCINHYRCTAHTFASIYAVIDLAAQLVRCQQHVMYLPVGEVTVFIEYGGGKV